MAGGCHGRLAMTQRPAAASVLPYEQAASKFYPRLSDTSSGYPLSPKQDAPVAGDVQPAGGSWSGYPMARGPNRQPVPDLPPPRPLPMDPHQRTTPTVTGGRLELEPHENPLERVLVLSQQLEAAVAQNQTLQSRIQELQAQGQTREQALNEAIRQVEQATLEVERSRRQIQELQQSVEQLQQDLRQLEQEDIELFRAIIAALEKLLAELPRREQ